MSSTPRIGTIVACCLLAAMTPFIAGTSTAVLGVVPIAYAIWLVARSGWSRGVRVGVSITVLAATIGLAIGMLIVATAGSGD